MSDKMDFEKLLKMEEEGTLPNDFKDWDLANDIGVTIAHQAAIFGRLPESFSNWELTDNKGWTVAHLAAMFDHIPKDFKQWSLTDVGDSTVAHLVAFRGHLPKNFHIDYPDVWKMKDYRGISVEDEAIENGYDVSV